VNFKLVGEYLLRLKWFWVVPAVYVVFVALAVHTATPALPWPSKAFAMMKAVVDGIKMPLDMLQVGKLHDKTYVWLDRQ
jgi:hypothetical protein